MVQPVEFPDRSPLFLFVFTNIAFLTTITVGWSLIWIAVSVAANEWLWFARSGSVTVIIGGILSARGVLRFTSEARATIISKLTIFHEIPPGELAERKKDASAVSIGVFLMVAGTLIWAYGDLLPKKPNQSLEPTSVLGTSAAEQPLVPSTLVAHL